MFSLPQNLIFSFTSSFHIAAEPHYECKGLKSPWCLSWAPCCEGFHFLSLMTVPPHVNCAWCHLVSNRDIPLDLPSLLPHTVAQCLLAARLAHVCTPAAPSGCGIAKRHSSRACCVWKLCTICLWPLQWLKDASAVISPILQKRGQRHWGQGSCFRPPRE